MRLEHAGKHASGVPTVAEFWGWYQEAILATLRPHTVSGYEIAWRRRVRESFGDVPLTQLTTWGIESEAARWPVKDSTKRDALACLSKIMQAAVKAGIAPVNPCKGVQLARPTEGDPTGRALSRSEVGRLLAVIPPDGPYRWFILVLLFTGVRLGEASAFLVSDVDLESRVIKVTKTASPGRIGEIVVGPTKNGKVRMVPIPDVLMPVIEAATAGKAPTERAFTGPKGGFVTSRNLSRALKWRTLREQVKRFPPGEPALHWHDLRHTAATTLFLAGSSAPDVMAILGHSSLQVTQKYANTRADAARRGATMLSSYYADLEVTLRNVAEGGDEAQSVSDLEI